MHILLALSLFGGASHAADITRRKTGVGVHVANTARQDVQGGLALTFRTKDQLLVRITAPMAGAAYISPAFGAGADALWRTGPELKHDRTQLFLRYGGGMLVGTDRYGVDTILVARGVAGAEVHLGASPATIDFELMPAFLIAPYRAVDLAVGTGVSWWF